MAAESPSPTSAVAGRRNTVPSCLDAQAAMVRTYGAETAGYQDWDSRRYELYRAWRAQRIFS
jgi:hypothetical protein